MAASFSDPRYGLNVSLKKPSDDTVSRTYNYVNLKIGSASSGYGPDDIYEFAQAVTSLSGGITGGVSFNYVNVVAQIPIEYTPD